MSLITQIEGQMSLLLESLLAQETLNHPELGRREVAHLVSEKLIDQMESKEALKGAFGYLLYEFIKEGERP